MIKVCICGGGSLAHVCACVLSSQLDVEVNILTRRPQLWSHQIVASDTEGKTYYGHIAKISNRPDEVLPKCDIIFLCLPGFAIEGTLETIKPYIENTIVGSVVSSTGFFFAAHRVLGKKSRLFGFQRVPFIARTAEYGKSASLLGYKPRLAIAVENIEDRESLRQLVEKLWLTPTSLLSSHFEASLTNSNPILHTGRLYSMWKDWDGKVYDHNILFYKEWTDEASQIIIDMDKEFMLLLEVLPVTKDAIPSLLEYYECYDSRSLTKKISGIPAFQNITSPMKEVEGGYIPDFQSRYFTEDFPYGLYHIWQLAKVKGVSTPVIDMVYEWGVTMANNVH